MVSIEQCKQIALSFDDVTEKPHFDRCSFRTKKGIFATLDEKNHEMNLMFTPVEQEIFIKHDSTIFSIIPNKWGEKGATTVKLDLVSEKVLTEALKTAYELRINK